MNRCGHVLSGDMDIRYVQIHSEVPMPSLSHPCSRISSFRSTFCSGDYRLPSGIGFVLFVAHVDAVKHPFAVLCRVHVMAFDWFPHEKF